MDQQDSRIYTQGTKETARNAKKFSSHISNMFSSKPRGNGKDDISSEEHLENSKTKSGGGGGGTYLLLELFIFVHI